MDFEIHYTPEQEAFRQEVKGWIAKNVPEKWKSPTDQDDRTPEFFAFWREKHKELGDKGWLYPTYPKQYGGGGLTGDHEAILHEEFTKARVPGHFTNGLVHGALMVWGTEEQKQKFLKPMIMGRESGWQKYTEPQSGTDLANIQTTAVKDGDEWVLNGSNQFVTGIERPNWLYGPAKTDPEAPRHRNLGFFMIPFPHPGVEIVNQAMVNNGAQHFIYLHDARVPADHLIGGERQGWQVANTVLEVEHGGRGAIFPRDDETDALLAYMKEHKTKNLNPGTDSVVQQRAVEIYIESHINALFQMRNYSMYMAGTEMTYEGPAGGLFTRDHTLRNVARTRDVMGMYFSLGAKDPLAPHGGILETQQRSSFIRMHGAGSRNIAKVIVARRIGISRTQERAAATARV